MWHRNRGVHVPTDAPARLWRWHAASLCLAVRRQSDLDDRVVSLARLLKQLESGAHRVTRRTFVRRAGNGHLRRLAHVGFSTWSRRTRTHLDPAIPRRDLDKLRALTGNVRQFVNQYVAHSQGNGPSRWPSLKEMSRALRSVEKMALRYYTLLTGSAIAGNSLVETRQFNADTFFARPWRGARWTAPRWPPGLVARRGELFPSPDHLSKSEYLRLVRKRTSLVSALRSSFDWEREPPSPLRRALEERGLPSSDAAVAWLRDELVKEGAVWTKEPGTED